MIYKKVQTTADTSIYFVIIPKTLNANEIKHQVGKLYNEGYDYKVLGPIEYITDDAVMYYLQILPGGMFKNYDSHIRATFFNSPLASLKSAYYTTKLMPEVTEEDFLIVITETLKNE